MSAQKSTGRNCISAFPHVVNDAAQQRIELHVVVKVADELFVEPRRRIGRPAKRWDDQIISFAHVIFHSSWFQAANVRHEFS